MRKVLPIKIIKYFLVLLLTLILTSCAAYKNDFKTDGIPFVYYDSFVYENTKYEVYEVESIYLINSDSSINQVIKYEYQELENDNLSTDEWIINYLQDYDYHMNHLEIEKEVIDKLYEKIYDSLMKFEEILAIDLEYYPTERLIEREFLVDEKVEYTSVLLIDLLIPYRLVNKNNNQTNIIYIPVKTSLAYRNNNLLKLVFDDLVIDINYDDFVSLSNPEI